MFCNSQYWRTFTIATLLICLNTFVSPDKIRNSCGEAEIYQSLGKDVGDPLLLTRLLEKGDIESARNQSLVDNKNMIEGIESYAGYITVNKKYNSNLWFWYFPAKEQVSTEAPLVIWLQGGPGATSLFGLFEELGPFSVDETGNHLKENPYSWHKNHSLLFIDSPVGSGYSFTDHKEGYCRNQTKIGEHLYIFIDQFLRIYPELQSVPLYITGESYAGKHIPSLAYQIYKNNPTAERKINLQGLVIGNGFIDPPTMMNRKSEIVYQLGFVDDATRDILKDHEDKAFESLKKGDVQEARSHFDENFETLIRASKLSNNYNFAYEVPIPLYGPFVKFVQRSDIRRALHVGNKVFSASCEVKEMLRDDYMESAVPWLEELAENYKILSYSGQFDLNCPYVRSVQTYRSMQWNGSEEYLAASRKPWYHGKVLAGYVKKSGKFQEVLVRNAGHMVPTDQPIRSLQLLSSFIWDIPLSETAEDYEYEL